MSTKGNIPVDSLDSISTVSYEINSNTLSNSYSETNLDGHFNDNINDNCLNFPDQINIPNSQNNSIEKNDAIKNDISSFEFLKLIGTGHLGKVYLVKQNDKYFALKSMKKEKILKNKVINNIITEKKILETIDSPFIIKFHSSFQDQDNIFFLLDYHNGGELFFHLQKNKRFNEETVKFWAAQLYLALEHLHNNKIVYRDIKPENLILTDQGHLQLIDFGLAKTHVTDSNLTGTFCGTNEYIRILHFNLAPEAVCGQKYGLNFDWWGYGALLYELIYGIPAFHDKTKIGIYKKIVYSEPNYERIKVTDNFLDLIKKLLKKDVRHRINPKDIPSHPWFKEIDFNLIKNMKVSSPFKPKIEGHMDFSNFDTSFLKEELPSFIDNKQNEWCKDDIFKDI